MGQVRASKKNRYQPDKINKHLHDLRKIKRDNCETLCNTINSNSLIDETHNSIEISTRSTEDFSYECEGQIFAEDMIVAQGVAEGDFNYAKLIESYNKVYFIESKIQKTHAKGMVPYEFRYIKNIIDKNSTGKGANTLINKSYSEGKFFEKELNCGYLVDL